MFIMLNKRILKVINFQPKTWLFLGVIMLSPHQWGNDKKKPKLRMPEKCILLIHYFFKKQKIWTTTDPVPGWFNRHFVSVA
jgi:hypothetical protein